MIDLNTMVQSHFLLYQNTDDEQWYKEGYRTVISPWAVHTSSSMPVEYQNLKRTIRRLVRDGCIPKDCVRYIDHKKEPHILFKLSWLTMAATLRKFTDASAGIDMRNQGRHNDAIRIKLPWRLKNILASEQQDHEINSGLDALKNIDGTFIPYRDITPVEAPPTRVVQKNILQDILLKNPGVVIGEVHEDKSPKQFLINHAKALKESGVKVIFLEHFCDTMQPCLDQFLATGHMPTVLSTFVDDLNKRSCLKNKKNITAKAYVTGQTTYDFKGLLYAMQREGIRMIAIETTYSSVVKSGVYSNHTKRMAVVNHLFAKKLKDTAFAPGEKWTALVGSAHMTTHYGVPGFCEITGVPGILVSDSSSQEIAFNLEKTGKNKPSAHVHFKLNVQQNTEVAKEPPLSQKSQKPATAAPITKPSADLTFSKNHLITGMMYGLVLMGLMYINPFAMIGTHLISTGGQWILGVGVTPLIVRAVDRLFATCLSSFFKHKTKQEPLDESSCYDKTTEILDETMFEISHAQVLQKSKTLVFSESKPSSSIIPQTCTPEKNGLGNLKNQPITS